MPYSASLTTDTGSNVQWTLVGGELPAGLTFSEAGLLQGTPLQHGVSAITVKATTAAGNDTKTLSLRIRQKTSSISTTKAGIRGNKASGVKPNFGGEAAMSGDGRYVVFQSLADNLVSDDTNNAQDLFLHDRQTGEITRVSVGTGNLQGDRDTVTGTISDDGNTIAFMSFAGNLAAGDTNYVAPAGLVLDPSGGDIFVHDRNTKQTTRISEGPNGTLGTCDQPPLDNWPCNSFDPALSQDGNLVAFGSTFTNLVPGDTNKRADIFVYNRTTKTMEKASVGFGGAEANGWSGNPGISGDGRYVIFESTASNLVAAGEDTNGATDIFVYDRNDGTITLVSKNDGGAVGNHNSMTPYISRDGKWITFWSAADNLVAADTNAKADVFAVEWKATPRTMQLVSKSGSGVQADDDSQVSVISGNGRYVVFESKATNLIDGTPDTNGNVDIFVADLQGTGAGFMKRVSVNHNGDEAVGGASETPSISADGRFISFSSDATNLEDGDTNGTKDVFVTQRP